MPRWYAKNTSDETTSFVRYVLTDSNGSLGSVYGIAFYIDTNGELVFDVNYSVGGSNTPFKFKVNGVTYENSGVVNVGDSIELLKDSNNSTGTPVEATLIVPSEFAIKSSNVNSSTGGVSLTSAGLEVSNQGTISTKQDFSFDNEDGYGIIEIWFGDVSTSANDTLFKIETTDYNNFGETGWADMEFKTNGSNEFYGIYNNGSNDVILMNEGQWPTSVMNDLFLHVSPSNCSGLGEWNTSLYPQYGYSIQAVYNMFSCLQTKNLYNNHYGTRADSAQGFDGTNNEIENSSFSTSYNLSLIHI